MERHSKWALAHIFKMIEIIEHEADQGALDHMLQNIHEPMVQLQIADEKSFEKKTHILESHVDFIRYIQFKKGNDAMMDNFRNFTTYE